MSHDGASLSLGFLVDTAVGFLDGFTDFGLRDGRTVRALFGLKDGEKEGL